MQTKSQSKPNAWNVGVAINLQFPNEKLYVSGLEYAENVYRMELNERGASSPLEIIETNSIRSLYYFGRSILRARLAFEGLR